MTNTTPEQEAIGRLQDEAELLSLEEMRASIERLSEEAIDTCVCELSLIFCRALLTAYDDLEAVKDAAYAERNKVVLALAKHYPSGWKYDDPEWSVLYIDLPTGQVSWHFRKSEREASGLDAIYTGPWDGHMTEEKYARLAALKDRGDLEAVAEKLAEALAIIGQSWLKAVPEGLGPEFYHTLSFAGDKEIHDKLAAALQAWKEWKGES